MLLQTNSYIVPKDKRAEHARLLQRFRQTLTGLGCENFEVYEQVGANWSGNETTGRFVQLMRFKDRKQQQQVQAAERSDPTAQALIKEFCELINFPYQQQQGLFAVGFYNGIVPPVAGTRPPEQEPAAAAVPTPMPPEDIHPPDVHSGSPPAESAPDHSKGNGSQDNGSPDYGSQESESANNVAHPIVDAEETNPETITDPIEADRSN